MNVSGALNISKPLTLVGLIYQIYAIGALLLALILVLILLAGQ